MNEILQTDTSGTRTDAMARALFLASWNFNDGRQVTDIPIFDALSDASKQQLLDTCAAMECLLTEFPNESGQLLVWNLARVCYDAYHLHPFCDVPYFGFDMAPKDVKLLWYRYADQVLTTFYEVKHLPSSPHFTEIVIRGKL